MRAGAPKALVSTGSEILLALLAALIMLAPFSQGQTAPVERKFSESKTAVEKALKDLQPSLAGRLPVLDGFVQAGERALERFQRGYFQCETRVSATAGGGAAVQVSAKITAWYDDPVAAKSGYQTLTSNGRIENDLLDRLTDALAAKEPARAPSAKANSAGSQPEPPAAKISAPLPNASVLTDAIAASKTPLTATGTATAAAPKAAGDVASLETRHAVTDKHMDELRAEAKNLEEILHNQAHPENLAAVKKSGTPVLASPNEGAKVLFAATAQDEFEILDMNASWVHVRISGLSRGWVLRSSMELPQSLANATVPMKQETASAGPGTPFQVSGEQVASFPGSWAPLQGKTVEIISVQETNDKSANTGSHAKLEFAKSVLRKEYSDLAQNSAAAGIVLIFDAEDGGMMAATLPVLEQWKAGTLSDEALWRRCYFDPPEMAGQVANP